MKQVLAKLETPLTLVFFLLLISGLAFKLHGHYRGLQSERAKIFAELELSHNQNYLLLREIDAREEIINSFQGQIESIAGTVGNLKKLADTDEELLKKYSKVYFLNENYVPARLSAIAQKYVYNGSTNFLIHTDVWPYLQKLLDDSREAGQDLLVASAFRSFSTQSSLKNSYRITYGSGANAFSADQGYSEHQLGTAVDFTTKKIGAVFSGFGKETEYQWLLENAHRYGFILSYPAGNTFYKHEPWHWRYVGVELATKLYDEGQNFYDLDQREIDKYLIKIFD